MAKPMSLLDITQEHILELKRLRFSDPVRYVYSPLVYAWEPYASYLTKYALNSTASTILVGLNPGLGQINSGVPFGAVTFVRGHLGIEGHVGRPPREHPKRKVVGFDIRKDEVSGARLWSWAASLGPPHEFFSRFFVVNWLNLALFSEEGKNITPDKLKKCDRDLVEPVCDRMLERTVRCFPNATHVIGIGRYVENRIKQIFHGSGLVCGGILHPSPGNPKSNKHPGWQAIIQAQLEELGVPAAKAGPRRHP